MQKRLPTSPPARRPQQQQQQLPPPPNSNKRPRSLPPSSSPSPSSATQRLTPLEKKLYDAIRATRDAGAWLRDLCRDLGTTPQGASKPLRTLLGNRLVKEVKSIQFPNRKLYMASDFTPSREMSGGSWYVDGSLDTDLIAHLRQVCLQLLRQSGVSTADKIASVITSSGAFKVDLTPESVTEILGMMALDGEVEECVSTGVGDFAYVMKGRTCYRPSRGRPVGKEAAADDAKVAAGGLASVPCGVCPRIHECTPNGLISPRTCVYYDRWLASLDF